MKKGSNDAPCCCLFDFVCPFQVGALDSSIHKALDFFVWTASAHKDHKGGWKNCWTSPGRRWEKRQLWRSSWRRPLPSATPGPTKTSSGSRLTETPHKSEGRLVATPLALSPWNREHCWARQTLIYTYYTYTGVWQEVVRKKEEHPLLTGLAMSSQKIIDILWTCVCAIKIVRSFRLWFLWNCSSGWVRVRVTLNVTTMKHIGDRKHTSPERVVLRFLLSLSICTKDNWSAKSYKASQTSESYIKFVRTFFLEDISDLFWSSRHPPSTSFNQATITKPTKPFGKAPFPAEPVALAAQEPSFCSPESPWRWRQR